jgi:hypothetical protein
MEPKINKFILFLFAEAEDQDMFVRDIAEEVAIITKSEDMKFYYGSAASVFTFSSEENFDGVKEFLEIILCFENLTYFVLPYNKDTLSYGLTDEVENHLFGGDKTDILTDINKMDSNLKDVNKNNDEFFSRIFDEFPMFGEEEDDDIKNLIKKSNNRYVLSEVDINPILDKIFTQGRESLSEKELNLLNNYSNQIR